MFVDTPQGLVNSAHIVSAEADPEWPDGQCIVTLASGKTMELGIGLDELEKAAGPFVPAAPGFILIWATLPHQDERGVVFSEEVILAFRVTPNTPHGGPMPVTASGEPSSVIRTGGMRWTIQQPNGRCFGPDGDHDTADAFRATCERAARDSGAA